MSQENIFGPFAETYSIGEAGCHEY
jgi:hypothetical protein